MADLRTFFDVRESFKACMGIDQIKKVHAPGSNKVHIQKN